MMKEISFMEKLFLLFIVIKIIAFLFTSYVSFMKVSVFFKQVQFKSCSKRNLVGSRMFCYDQQEVYFTNEPV